MKAKLRKCDWIMPLPVAPDVLLYKACSRWLAADSQAAKEVCRQTEVNHCRCSVQLSSILSYLPRVWDACTLLYKHDLYEDRPLPVQKLAALATAADQVSASFSVSLSHLIAADGLTSAALSCILPESCTDPLPVGQPRSIARLPPRPGPQPSRCQHYQAT